MARKHEAAEWLKKGHSPSQIAKQMKVSLSTVKGYLHNQISEGKIRRSDIVFSLDQNTRRMIEDIVSKTSTTNWYDIYNAVQKVGGHVDRDDLQIYLEMRDTPGDLYENIRYIEVTLHSSIKTILISEYGATDWWRKGVPADIRADCSDAFVRDEQPAGDPYRYTNFIHLKEILEKQWNVISKALPKNVSSDRKTLLSGLVKLNQIRNFVMHPVKGKIPTDEDFAFVREFLDYLELDKWRKHGAIPSN